MHEIHRGKSGHNPLFQALTSPQAVQSSDRIPFGSTLSGASAYLENLVAPRLVKNQKLARHLEQGREYGHMRSGDGELQPTMTLPCDTEAVVELFKYIARGLAFHHWRVLMPAAEVLCSADSSLPTVRG